MTALENLGLNLDHIGKVTAHLKNVRNAVATVADDIAQGFMEITHNSLALLGMAVVFAVITLIARPTCAKPANSGS
jgi:phage-related protein